MPMTRRCVCVCVKKPSCFIPFCFWLFSRAEKRCCFVRWEGGRQRTHTWNFVVEKNSYLCVFVCVCVCVRMMMLVVLFFPLIMPPLSTLRCRYPFFVLISPQLLPHRMDMNDLSGIWKCRWVHYSWMFAIPFSMNFYTCLLVLQHAL